MEIKPVDLFNNINVVNKYVRALVGTPFTIYFMNTKYDQFHASYVTLIYRMKDYMISTIYYNKKNAIESHTNNTIEELRLFFDRGLNE